MKIRNVIIVLWGVIILTSCATPKTVSYFPNLSDGDKMIVKESKGIFYQSRGASGYTIDPDGYIDFPLVGKVKAAGMTRAGLADYLKRTMAEKDVASDAVVTIEYINLGFSVLGEVKNPGFYLFDSDKLTLLQALSKAGDMTIYGDRMTVKVIRQRENGDQEAYVLNMQDADAVMKSPAYILQQNETTTANASRLLRVISPMVHSGFLPSLC